MNKKGHVPMRMCIGCRSRRRKGQMVRFTRSNEGMVLTDRKKDLRGRGVYLCADLNCLKMARKKTSQGNLWDRWIPVFAERKCFNG